MITIVNTTNPQIKIRTKEDVIDGRMYISRWGYLYIANKYEDIALFSVDGEGIIENANIAEYDLREVNATIIVE